MYRSLNAHTYSRGTPAQTLPNHDTRTTLNAAIATTTSIINYTC